MLGILEVTVNTHRVLHLENDVLISSVTLIDKPETLFDRKELYWVDTRTDPSSERSQ